MRGGSFTLSRPHINGPERTHPGERVSFEVGLASEVYKWALKSRDGPLVLEYKRY